MKMHETFAKSLESLLAERDYTKNPYPIFYNIAKQAFKECFELYSEDTKEVLAPIIKQIFKRLDVMEGVADIADDPKGTFLSGLAIAVMTLIDPEHTNYTKLRFAAAWGIAQAVYLGQLNHDKSIDYLLNEFHENTKKAQGYTRQDS